MTKSNVAAKKLGKVIRKVWPWFVVNLVLLTTLVFVDVTLPPKALWWRTSYSLLASALTGGLVSFFFYWLVVYLPEKRKRQVIKHNLSKMYHRIKRDILFQVVFASQKGGRNDLRADTDTIAELMTIDGFKSAFKDGREADEGFYAFENQMSDDTHELQQILLNLELLTSQISFVLHNYPMDDENLFDFFKRLELMLLSLRRSTAGYDESKPLCNFIYRMFSGWDDIYGYSGYDVIERMIADI